MTVAISSTVQLAAGTPCIFVGAILMLCSLAVNDKSKGGFIAMIVLGAILFAVGLIILLLPVEKTNVPPPPSSTPLFPLGSGQHPAPASSAGKRALGSFSRVAAAPSSLELSPSRLGIRWKDDDKLESVKEFVQQEAPQEVAVSPEHVQAAHEPKAVPAVPTKRLVARLGYESASAPVPPDSQQYMADSFQTAMQSDGPLAGGYTRLVPLSDTVETRLRERQEFEAFRDSDTLEAQKHRRYALLREAAWSQPLLSRDGLIPILGPNGEDLTQGRCNSIEANSI